MAAWGFSPDCGSRNVGDAEWDQEGGREGPGAPRPSGDTAVVSRREKQGSRGHSDRFCTFQVQRDQVWGPQREPHKGRLGRGLPLGASLMGVCSKASDSTMRTAKL